MAKNNQYEDYEDEFEDDFQEGYPEDGEYDEPEDGPYDSYDEDDYEYDRRAEYRHSRRIRNQTIVVIVTILLILGIAVGGFFGVTKLISVISERTPQTVETETGADESREDAGGEVETPETENTEENVEAGEGVAEE